MARIQAKDFEDKKHVILLKASIQFAKNGFSGATMAEIAKRIGVSKSLLYHYYKDKDQILYEIMLMHVDALLSVVRSPSIKDKDPKKEFANLLSGVLEIYSGAENAQKVLLYELDNLSRKRRQEIIKKERDIIAAFEATFARIDPDFQRDKGRLRSRVMLFFGMINWLHTWYDPKGTVSFDDLKSDIVQLMARASK